MISPLSIQAFVSVAAALITLALAALIMTVPASAVSEPYGTIKPIINGWVRAEDTPGAKLDAPVAPILDSGDGELHVTWAALTDNDSSIIDYDVRYRQNRYSMWQGVYDGGTSIVTTQNDTSDGPGGDPVDLGEIASGLSVILTREAVGSNYGVYKLGSAVGGLRIKLVGSMTSSGTIRARYASTKPTASTLDSHGTQLWSAASGSLARNPFSMGIPLGMGWQGFGSSGVAGGGWFGALRAGVSLASTLSAVLA